jgi:peptidase MA superfamily protein
MSSVIRALLGRLPGIGLALAVGWTGVGNHAANAQAAPGSAPPATRPPTLIVDAPADYAADAQRLQQTDPPRLRALMSLVGLRDGGDPIHVVLAPEYHPLARGVPPGIAGYAVAERDLAVLLPERVPRYPYDSLDVLLLHEVTHVLASRAAGGHELPRWWNEGLALLASRGWSLEDRSRVIVGAVSGMPDNVDALEASFDGGPYEVSAAYALSGALVHHLVRRHGDELVAATLARVAAGEDFDAAFAAVAGVPLAEDVAGFWRRYRLWYRWLPFLTSGAVLWGAVTALALLAGVRRRQRDAAIRRRWEEEERVQHLAEMASDTSETVH